MNKAELVEKVANQTGLTKRASREAVGTITSLITEALAWGENVTLVGFGTFRVRSRRARTGRNPQTGGTIQIPGKRVTKFVAGKSLRQAVE